MADEVIDLMDAYKDLQETPDNDQAIRLAGDRLRQQKHHFNEALENKIREIVRKAIANHSFIE